MQPWLKEKYGNPSTLYSLSREPRKAVSDARNTIASAIGARPEEIFFTSGGTEADNWALKGTAFNSLRKRTIVTTVIEHHAILNSCLALKRLGYHISQLDVDKKGVVCSSSLEKEMTEDTAIVSVMLANNEIGTIEPIKELAMIAHQSGCVFHTDAVQAVGHIPVDVQSLGVDMLSASAHKFNGPKGIGFLYVRSGTELVPLIDGGGQERGMRAGTENVANIVGMAVALNEHVDNMKDEEKYLNSLSKLFLSQLEDRNLDFIVNGSEYRIPGNVSLSFGNADGEMILHRLDLLGTSIATGSACNSKEKTVSHVIQAIGVPADYSSGSIRITFGKENTEEDAILIADQLQRILI